MKKKVYEYANILGISNERMIDILWDNSINVDNHLEMIDDQVLEPILKNYNDIVGNLHINKSSFKRIIIQGLFNKKNYDIKFEEDVKILISENGSGKTTILNIIISTLKGDIQKLRKLPFESIKVEINDKLLEIKRKELLDNTSVIKNLYEIERELRRWLSREQFISIMNILKMNKFLDIDEILKLLDDYDFPPIVSSKVRRILYSNVGVNNEYEVTNNSYKNLNELCRLINEDIIYFPTYRRVEGELDEILHIRNSEKIRWRDELVNCDVNFGISDVKLEIKRLTDKLREEAAEYYTKMSAEILNDLLSGKGSLKNNEKKKINVDKINIVIGRIGEDKIKEIDKLRDFIKNREYDLESEFLLYYIYKLISIYEKQKSIDDRIKRYLSVCNKYLVNKSMIYDEVKVRVYVFDKESNKEIKLQCLSSGEKQILSLFAKLYLIATKPCIFIIDEPELSLSILWQKTLIEDIYNSNKVKLFISTTHSPFIFKNKYSRFANELDQYKSE